MGACCSHEGETEISQSMKKSNKDKKSKKNSKGKGAGVATEERVSFKDENKTTGRGEVIDDAFTDAGDIETDDDGNDSDDFEFHQVTLEKKGQPKRLFKPAFIKSIKFSRGVSEKQGELGNFEYRYVFKSIFD